MHSGNKEENVIRTCCPSHNCGGRCLLLVHVRDGQITRIRTDDRPQDSLSDPQRRACTRGLAYRKRLYHPNRLKYPMKRVGKRGAGKFQRVSWQDALDHIASEMERIKSRYGNEAFYVPYGTGSYNQTNGRDTVNRLFHLYGGCLNAYNSYSWACISRATPTVYGTKITGNQRQDWINSKTILMWGWNPAEMRDGTNSDFFVKQARKQGARVFCIDPRMSMSAVSLADEWIPIRPGTDVAMMSAMAYVMIQENWIDRAFVERCCIGFDQDQMPEGLSQAESYSDYILGIHDQLPKTPQWAEELTGVPSETIVRVARAYACQKPAVLYQGYGMQRRAYGEQVVRAGCALAAITGNVGISGGWASGMGLAAPDGGPRWEMLPTLDNPVKTSIPTFLWTEAVTRGTDMGADLGVLGRERLKTPIKMIYAVASNALINQHANINRTARILSDENLVTFLVVQDQFLTPTGRFADILLPACNQFEVYGLQDGWKYGEELILGPKIIDPPFETKSDYQICSELAEKLGIGNAYTEGRDERAWTEHLYEQYRTSRYPDMPDFETFVQSNAGIYTEPVTKPAIAFASFRQDPVQHPLPTPSGKVELFSRELFDLNQPAEIPAVPKYIREWASPFGPEAETYPLQALGHHVMNRVHSTHAQNEWLQEAFPQRVFLNPIDARTRGIVDGDLVKVFNEYGTMMINCRLTDKLMPGVVDIPQGAWWQPDENGVDRGGSINVLTSERWTPLAFGNAQHTIMVQVEKSREKK